MVMRLIKNTTNTWHIVGKVPREPGEVIPMDTICEYFHSADKHDRHSTMGHTTFCAGSWSRGEKTTDNSARHCGGRIPCGYGSSKRSYTATNNCSHPQACRTTPYTQQNCMETTRGQMRWPTIPNTTEKQNTYMVGKGSLQ